MVKPREVVFLLLGALLVVAGCTSRTGDDVPSTLEAAERQAQAYKQELARKDQEIARLSQELADLKKASSNAGPAAPRSEPSVATGQGDGRFVVVPSSLRPGDTIAIYNDLPNTEVSLFRMESDTRIARLSGPKPRSFVFYTFPSDVAPGEYLVTIVGPGGSQGQAKVTVEQGH
ncbi:MAG TPA: hypothetical protein VK464_19185 [Symbiobacteriaceae bacterium]|jgi:hypothetical protein|nr:hypothetical protein [Symbiobacteriaceae bacterium]